jgi:hypothetical protein
MGKENATDATAAQQPARNQELTEIMGASS